MGGGGRYDGKSARRHSRCGGILADGVAMVMVPAMVVPIVPKVWGYRRLSFFLAFFPSSTGSNMYNGEGGGGAHEHGEGK